MHHYSQFLFSFRLFLSPSTLVLNVKVYSTGTSTGKFLLHHQPFPVQCTERPLLTRPVALVGNVSGTLPSYGVREEEYTPPVVQNLLRYLFLFPLC